MGTANSLKVSLAEFTQLPQNLAARGFIPNQQIFNEVKQSLFHKATHKYILRVSYFSFNSSAVPLSGNIEEMASNILSEGNLRGVWLSFSVKEAKYLENKQTKKNISAPFLLQGGIQRKGYFTKNPNLKKKLRFLFLNYRQLKLH